MELRLLGEYVIPLAAIILVIILEIWDPIVVDVLKLLIKRTQERR
jgi:hypothetical protein